MKVKTCLQPESAELVLPESHKLTRRNFIKGIIAAGTTVSAVSLLGGLGGCSGGGGSAPGAVERLISLDRKSVV